MTSRLITLQAWAEAIYGDAAPKAPTLCAWAKSGKIMPAPQKHGRTYFVAPDARYVTAGSNEGNDAQPVMERSDRTPQKRESAVEMIERMIQERKAKDVARKRQR
jgi:hypothetical protein